MSSYHIRGPWGGRLSIISRPRGGDWLQDEMRALKNDGLDAVVSLLTTEELEAFELLEEQRAAQEHGLQFLSLPIVDMSVPDSPEETFARLQDVEKLLLSGKNVGIHCRQGIGRSSVIAACLLVMSGTSVDDAFSSISHARGLPVPETLEQRRWATNFATEFSPSAVQAS